MFHAKHFHHLVVPVECVVREYEVQASERRKQDAGPKNQGDIDLSNPVSVARELGTTKRKLMADQEKLLKEAAERKKREDKARLVGEKKGNKTAGAKDPELEQLKDVLGESVNVPRQKQLMEAIKKREQEKPKVRVNPPPSQSQQCPDRRESTQAGGHGIQKQNSWQPQGTPHLYDPIPGSDRNSSSTRPHLAEHGKAGSVGGNHEQAYQFQRQIEQSQGTRYHQGEHSNPVYVNQPPPPPGQYNDRQQGQQDGYNYQQNTNYYQGDQQYGNVQKIQPPPYNYGGQMQHTDQSNVRPQETPAGREQHPPSNAHQTTPGPSVVAHTVPADFNLGVGSTVQLAIHGPNSPPRYGVIRWIEGPIAGIELVRHV